MKNNKIIALILLLAVSCFTGCEEESEDNLIVIQASMGKIGQALDDNEKMYQIGDTIVYRFEVNSPDGIAKIEFSNFEGLGVNQKAPVVLSKIENIAGTTWTLVDTIVNIQTDVRFSVYVQDLKRQYQTKKINAYLDVSRFLTETLYDGLANGTSKTFLNVESGRTFFVANTLADPSGIDMGFAYLENRTDVLACLVSFDEYWNTGNYASIVNNLNQPVEFRKSTPTTATTSAWIKERVKNSADTKAMFEAATPYPSVPGLFPDGKVALNLKAKDVVTFKTADGRYGVIQVTLIDPKSGSPLNTQKINFAMVVDKKMMTN